MCVLCATTDNDGLILTSNYLLLLNIFILFLKQIQWYRGKTDNYIYLKLKKLDFKLETI